MAELTLDLLKHYQVIVQKEDNDRIVLAKESLENLDGITPELEFITGKKVVFVAADPKTITEELNKAETKLDRSDFIEELPSSNNNVIDLLTEALNLGASDIHIERYETNARVRFRIDGQMIQRYSISETQYPSVVNKIKVQANLDIAEKRLPQDGRLRLSDDFSLDVRVSTTPAIYGEKVVMRLLNNGDSFMELSQLGLSQQQFNLLKKNIEKQHGMVLISGPTGSGKTTTLYGALSHLNSPDKNIITIEDPVEYTLTGVNQVQLKEGIGLTYGSALRSFLRQDPDIIMIGEIRDRDTADMVVRASLTGHLVLSTIHTNSSFGIIARLIDIGVQPFLVAETINLAVAQRLVRKVCEHCSTEEKLSAEIQSKYNIEKHVIGPGCDHCYHTGYSGRKALYEMLEVDEELRSLIQQGVVDFNNYSKKDEVKLLADSALDLVKKGITSFTEIQNLLN